MGLYPEAVEEKKAEETPSQPDIKKTAPVEGGEEAEVPAYEGEPGPIENRQCRDIFFLLLFIGSWIGYFTISGLAISYGNSNRLYYGNDTEGNLCGVVNEGGRDHTSRPYQYIFNPIDPYSTKLCLSACPEEYGDVICQYDFPTPSLEFNSTLDLISLLASSDDITGNCTLTYKTKLSLNRCFMDITSLLDNSTFLDYFSTDNSTTELFENLLYVQETGTQIFSDLYKSWSTVLICSVIALIISFLWLFLVQWFASFVVWLTLIGVNVVGIASTAYIWFHYNEVRVGNAADPAFASIAVVGKYNEEVLLALAVIMSIIFGLIFLLTVSLRKRIQLAVTLIEETSQAIRSMPLVIFFPIGKYVAILALTAWTIFIWVMLVTSGSTVTAQITEQAAIQLNGTGTDQELFEPNAVFQYLTIYVAFSYFWTSEMIGAVTQTTIAGAIAGWYWTMDKKSIPVYPVWSSFYRTIRYHLGSLALGSLIIAIIQTIRAILYYIQMQMRNQKENRFLQCLVSCVQCCLWCVEKFMKFINKNAYIEIAIYGYGFCKAARTAFFLLLRNALRLVVVDRVGAFLFFLGKILITLLTCIVGAAMLAPGDEGGSDFWAVPLILIAISSYAIASGFMSVVDMAVDTMFLCFCEDSERNNGGDKPYYMTESLKHFVDSNPEKAKL